MPIFLLALASALLLAAISTEIFTRFLTLDYWTLMVVSVITLLINGLFMARVATQRDKTTASDNTNTDNKANNRQSQSKGGREGNSRNQPARNRNNRQSRDNDTRRNQGNNKQGNNRNQKSGGQQNKEPRQRQQDKPAAASPAQSSTSAAPSGPREEGTVKWFNRSKGYGFVIRANGDEIFVHQRSIASTDEQRQRPVLHDGQKVTFVVSEHEKGAQAEHVQTAD